MLEALDYSCATTLDATKTKPSHHATGHTSASHTFVPKTMFCRLGSIALSTGVHLPTRANVRDYTTYIMLPMTGSAAFESQGNKLEARAGHTGILLSDAKLISKTNNYSGVTICFDKVQLMKIAKMMACIQETADINFSHDRHLHLNPHPNFSFDMTLRHLHNLIVSNQSHPEILRLLGIEELFYRNIVLLLKPELLSHVLTPIKHPASRPHYTKIDAVCEYILANLRGVITLADLEAHSGLSVRTLQYQFKKRFNCTPVEWIRKERLKIVYLELLAPENKSTTIFCIALRCGFNHAGEFSKQFGMQYGASPSEVRARGY